VNITSWKSRRCTREDPCAARENERAQIIIFRPVFTTGCLFIGLQYSADGICINVCGAKTHGRCAIKNRNRRERHVVNSMGRLTHMHGSNAVRSTAQQAGNRASAGSVRRLTVCGVTIEHGENTQSALPFHNMPVYSFHALHNRPTNNRIMISSTGVLSSPLSILERQQNAKNRS
jgi:hypothetical protein